jgi:hypothetical protein
MGSWGIDEDCRAEATPSIKQAPSIIGIQTFFTKTMANLLILPCASAFSVLSHALSIP